MGTYTAELTHLTQDLVSQAEWQVLSRVIAIQPYSPDDFADFDLSLGGPSMNRLTCHNTGRYDVRDRGILRPLQYCGSYIELEDGSGQIEWLTRELVHMSGLHLENLLKRVGGYHQPWPLGVLLKKPLVQSAVAPPLRSKIERFLGVYNASKHETEHPKDTHLFSLEDALLSYVITRRLGNQLYPLAKLYTDMTIFDTECP